MKPAVALAATVLCGCVGVRSIQPLYTPDTLVFEPALAGAWTDEKGEVTFEVRQRDRDYSVTVREKKKAEESFQVHLVRIGGELFLDVTDDKHSTMAIPAHGFAKLTLEGGDKAGVAFFGSAWLRDQIRRAKPMEFALSPMTPGGKESDREVYLLGPPDKLRELVARYRGEARAFGDAARLRRVAKR